MQGLLSIDDSVNMGDWIARIASPLGFACQHAASFTDFKVLLAGDPAVIVVDLIMPDVDGIEVLRYLGEQQCRAGIVLLSGSHLRVLSVAEAMARSLGLRVLGGLPKPFTAAALEAVLPREATPFPDVIRTRTQDTITPADLQRALAEKQFAVHYQPQIDSRSGVPVGAEVLVRWQHPVHGLLFPDAFISQCESWDLIDSLMWAVVDIAFNDTKVFEASGWRPTLSINVSALSLRDVNLPDKLIARAKAAGAAPGRIVVEITESEMIGKEANVLDTLARLRLHGFSLSIDDFGTGFSMMHQLQRVPANEIKIDKEFVRVMHYDDDARIIVRKTIEIGHEMGMTVVAEGVETAQQLKILATLDCDLAQGYLFARPMPLANAITWGQTQLAATQRPSQLRYRHRQSAAASDGGQEAWPAASDAITPLDQDTALKRLLVVEDAPEMAALVSVIATPLGYTCTHAATFEQFKAALAKGPAVIVVDLIMPDVDGIEVLRYLSAQQCRAGILLYSRSERSILSVAAEMARSAGLNVIGVLGKPFARHELENILRDGVAKKVTATRHRAAPPPVRRDELRRAIAGNQFRLRYQPRVDIKTGTVAGLDVLVYWQHPLHGLLSPRAFVGLLDSAALAGAMTTLVSNLTFRESTVFSSREWNPTLSINVPVDFLKDIRIPDLLLQHAQTAGIYPARIVIEIADSGALEDVTLALDILARLRLCGFNLSIDDFGAGFSMMHQLKRIPANEIKIDKAFVSGMASDADARIIVRKTIEIGHEMGMTVVAKGVETPSQMRMLGEMHCDLAQGRLFSARMPAADVAAWRNTFESREVVVNR